MRKLLPLLAILLFTLSCNTQEPIKVILLAGQSNMAGCGNYDALSTEQKERIEKASEHVTLISDGVKQNLPYCYSKYQEDKRGYGNVFGPELFIGVTLAEKYPKQKFLLIKRAQGGTSLYGAWSPEWDVEKSRQVEKGFKQDLKLVEEHCASIDKELSALDTKKQAYEIIGMAWMQGENDAAKEISARTYKKNLTEFIAFYRQRYNIPNMPFVMGQINSRYGRFAEGPAMVRLAFVDVANSDDNCTVLLTTTDTTWNDYPKTQDNVHYNHIGQMRLGKKMAEELIRSIDK